MQRKNICGVVSLVGLTVYQTLALVIWQKCCTVKGLDLFFFSLQKRFSLIGRYSQLSFFSGRATAQPSSLAFAIFKCFNVCEYWAGNRELLCQWIDGDVTEKLSIPAEWDFFIRTLRKRKNDVSSRLTKWYVQPSSLNTFVDCLARGSLLMVIYLCLTRTVLTILLWHHLNTFYLVVTSLPNIWCTCSFFGVHKKDLFVVKFVHCSYFPIRWPKMIPCLDREN